MNNSKVYGDIKLINLIFIKKCTFIGIQRMNKSQLNARIQELENQNKELEREVSRIGDSKYFELDWQYPRDIFAALLRENSPYAFYLLQWVPYQKVKDEITAQKWRLKMLHDVKTFDGQIQHRIWPNGNSCGSFKDDEVEFIRISPNQFGHEYDDPRGKPTPHPCELITQE